MAILGLKTVKRDDWKEAGKYLAQSILAKLEKKKKVLWLVAGGSSIPAAVVASKIIARHPHRNLAVTLTDERFGPKGHADSNWAKLLSRGFALPEAKIFFILTDKNMEATVEKFRKFLEEKFEWADWKVGIFGVGEDGHTAGILPESPAVSFPRLAFGYYTEKFNRITMTAKAIGMLDEAIVFAQGEKKRRPLRKLEEEISVAKMPAQALKKARKLTIFTDLEARHDRK